VIIEIRESSAKFRRLLFSTKSTDLWINVGVVGGGIQIAFPIPAL
jgi:hypothetical protein